MAKFAPTDQSVEELMTSLKTKRQQYEARQLLGLYQKVSQEEQWFGILGLLVLATIIIVMRRVMKVIQLSWPLLQDRRKSLFTLIRIFLIELVFWKI